MTHEDKIKARMKEYRTPGVVSYGGVLCSYEDLDAMFADITKLRALLLELYVSGSVQAQGLPFESPENQRLFDTVLAAAEGRPFELLGLPFPRNP